MKIYCTTRNPASATVRFEDDDGLPLEGTIRGPFCHFSRTLPASIPIRNGQALVVDPCYWTPRLPFRYEVTIEESNSVDAQQFMWGIRWCVPHHRNLFVDGKGYVVRAVGWSERFELEAYRELSCSLITHTALHASIYQRASELGVLIVDASAADSFLSSDRTLEPSVHFFRPALSSTPVKWDALAMKQVEDPLGADLQDPSQPANGIAADVCLANESIVQSGTARNIASPLLVERRIDLAELADMRRACDTLQSDLAPLGQFAGYLVSVS